MAGFLNALLHESKGKQKKEKKNARVISSAIKRMTVNCDLQVH